MRSARLTAAALVASCAVVLTGCGGDNTESASGGTTPTASTSSSQSVSPSATPDATDTTASGDISAFPTVDGFTYKDLPAASFKQLNATLKASPKIQGVEAKVIEKDGQEAGLAMRIAIDPTAASAAGFEEGFLPGVASGIAGSSAAPSYEDINGTKVVTIAIPNQTGSAYAWLEGSIATVLVFKDTADAETFAQAALA